MDASVAHPACATRRACKRVHRWHALRCGDLDPSVGSIGEFPDAVQKQRRQQSMQALA
jgi:hypothetical protein